MLSQTSIDDVEIVDWSTTPERGAANSELRDKLWEGINRLEPGLRAAVVLRDVQGLSNGEAAEALDVTIAALKSRLHRARVLLRNHLSDYVATAS
jgi:RNA polymerase sigma-70 factor (ECF subfamily)